MIFGICSLDSRGDPFLIRRSLRRLGAFYTAGGRYAGKNAGLSCDSRAAFFENPDMETRIVYGGEIYNYSALRLELENAGFNFRSGLDSELVLHAYSAWGDDCQKRFNGEWSFAVWDGEKKRFFCSRDRFGLRPFYYFFDGIFFVFGSVIKTLFSCPFIKKEPNNGAISDYLVLNRANLPGETFFKDIRQLQAGRCLFLSPEKGLVKRKYYSPRYNPELGEFDKKALKKHSVEFLGLLKSSLKARMLPPYPIGGTLSGGMDSSTIVCLADSLTGGSETGRKSGSGKLKIFSITWKAESKYIKAVSRAVSFSHHRIKPAEAKKTSWEEVKKAVSSCERPLNSTVFLGELAILKKARREKIKVLFDGGGGDELLAGYPERYFSVYLNQLIYCRNIPRFIKEFKILYSTRLREFGLGKEIDRGFYKTFLRTQSNVPQLSDFFPEETVNQAFFRKYARRRRMSLPGLPLNLQKVLFRDTLNLGNEYDTQSSISYRRPFLDYRLAEYIFSLPACYKIHNGWTKYLLRAAMRDILPKDVCWRKEKVGGTVPIAIWKDFLTRNRSKIKAVLAGRKFYSAGFLNQKAIVKNFDALFRTAVSPDTTDISGLWRFVNLELWLRENMTARRDLAGSGRRARRRSVA